LSILAVLVAGTLVRAVWLQSDPPLQNGAYVGVVWHDEGAWVHNARNKALWGMWRTDNWNPVFLTPVFTLLEYGAFRVFGVGLWQARTIPLASGLVAIVCLAAGVRASAGRRAALVAGALLGIDYAFVMWNRAALMESTMTALVICSWAAYALGESRPGWGFASGVLAVASFFAKASAAYFVAALVLECLTALALGTRVAAAPAADVHARAIRRRSWWSLAGLVAAGALIAVLFVLPHWPEFRFYNWQMPVLRKPEYTLHALIVRASWLPLVHDFFMWMWPTFALATLAIGGVVSRWRKAPGAERLLVLWVVVGLTELVVHDSGNERRYVMFIPAIVALAALAFSQRPWAAPGSAPRARWLALPLAIALGYLVAGSAIRSVALDDVHAGIFHRIAIWSAIVGSAVAVGVVASWQVLSAELHGRRLGAVAAAAVAATLAGDVWHLGRWAADRQSLNYEASVAIGRLLPPDTLVQGKLANGLSLENRIHPIFVGHGFGNYVDRLHRDDAGYILTYVSPEVGYESGAGSGLIQEILDQYPNRRIIALLPVDETGGRDQAALIEKTPGSHPRARD
jgi:4-amino-4-deoxy-L-arabinose transferase-like glycosyltransferase